jgi:hypothetical protein
MPPEAGGAMHDFGIRRFVFPGARRCGVVGLLARLGEAQPIARGRGSVGAGLHTMRLCGARVSGYMVLARSGGWSSVPLYTGGVRLAGWLGWMLLRVREI